MSLTDGDKAECKEIARAIMKEVMKEHVKTCPHWQHWLRSKMFVIGLCLGTGLVSGVGSGGMVLAVFKLLSVGAKQ